jgi:REP element-mobilizing transposase RayT
LKVSPVESGAFYHCVSRVVDRQYIFDDAEKQIFHSLVREYSAFCGIHVLTHCYMDNHFHLVLEVPRQPETPLSTEQVIERLSCLTGTATSATQLQAQIDQCRTAGDLKGEQVLVARVAARMGDLSVFMKLLKQRYTQGYNRRHERRGTLWESRFASVLAEGREALVAVSGYTDLNPVRAQMVTDPKDYRWNGYGQALGGDKVAEAGLRRIAAAVAGIEGDGTEALEWYRTQLYGRGEAREGTDEAGQPLRAGLDAEAVKKVLEEKGKLPLNEYVRCRVRYFSAGVVLGSAAFVNEMYKRFRDRFGRKAEDGARRMRGVQEPLYALRDLRRRVFW